MMFSAGKPNAIIFDLDGTLVSSSLDFSLIRKDIGCPNEMDILSFVSSLNVSDKKEAENIIQKHEFEDAKSAQEIDGVLDVLQQLKSQGIKLGIVTRNSHQATSIKLERTKIQVEHVLTREMAKPKPAPDALLTLANRWNYSCRTCLYVGDYRYDLEAAKNADMHAVWFANYQTNQKTTTPDYSALADMRFDHYKEFLPRLNDYWRSLS